MFIESQEPKVISKSEGPKVDRAKSGDDMRVDPVPEGLEHGNKSAPPLQMLRKESSTMSRNNSILKQVTFH